MKFGKKTIALIGAVAMLSSVAACGSTSAGDGEEDTGSSDKKVELTVLVLGFHTASYGRKGFEANPNIKVKVTNAGTNKDEYNALSNAIEAGSGAPDIAQIEYYALPRIRDSRPPREPFRSRCLRFQGLLHPGHVVLGEHQ